MVHVQTPAHIVDSLSVMLQNLTTSKWHMSLAGTYPANAYSNKRWCCNDMDHFDVSCCGWATGSSVLD
jgi:hypothetical protein